MIRVLALVAVFALVWGCAGDQEMQEPVGGADEPPPAIPDSPGSGETADKAAGDGFAAADTKDEGDNNAGNSSAASSAPKPSAANMAGSMFVQSDGLNVRSGGGMKYDVVRILPMGSEVTVGDCNSVWCQIGPNEYVSKRFLGSEKPQSK